MRSRLPPVALRPSNVPQSEIQPADTAPAPRESLTLGELFQRHKPRPKLGALLDQARRQDRAEQTEKAEQARQSQRAELAQWVHSALPDGGAAMKRLKDRASRKHPGTMAERWHAIRTGSPKRMEGERKKAFEALVRADLLALATQGGSTAVQAADKMHEALAEGIVGQGILEKDRALLNEVLDGLSMAPLYREFNLKITDATLPAFTDAQVLEPLKKIGEGKMSTTYGIKLMGPEGVPITAAFKPLELKDTSFVALRSGIPKENPQTAMRNLATVAYAKKLGFDVITDTRMALISNGGDPFKPLLGMVMDLAPGDEADYTKASVLRRGDVTAGVVKLQLLDHLTGQGDRHGSNYFIHIDANDQAKVTGIDNDQCFGKNLTKPQDIQKIDGNSQRWAFNGTALPPVVDTDMERAIKALTEGDIREMLEDKLDGEEIQAAVQRHQGLKEYIAQLKVDGLVINPDGWWDKAVQELLTPVNSYLGRELPWAKE
ncbi:hypothetical protein [Acidovorax sp. SUPP2539]|uniref:hypothetical protein n=1 Tax=Acidovorax sp. SUPP2539 TaxID=2920878 RepID=UPI0023DE394B|nr:hypothetical protein [Acidovorax sp. SUPP2539]GKS92146.1 hypothetical protein AVTE2539_22295 [Acidovorax sp. SUPP2539]